MSYRTRSLKLHACKGVVRLWRIDPAQTCRCGAPLAGDLPFRPGHDAFNCGFCGQTVGICSAVELAEVVEAAELFLTKAFEMRRRAEGDSE